jgi:CubicO group peptidase (beta-lactamase class C family)
MKRLILAAGGLLLATANTPPTTTASVAPGGELDSVVAADSLKTSAPAAAAKPAKPKPQRIDVAADERAAKGYPRCSGAVRDRCVQGGSGYARSSHGKVHHERRMQLAMRAGERG